MTKAAVSFLRSPNISDADINRGKTELKAAVLYGVESNQGLLENITQQALLKGKVSSPSSVAAEIDKISSADVQNVSDNLLFVVLFRFKVYMKQRCNWKCICFQAALKLSTGKMSMGAIGDLRTVPYIDEM